MMGNNKAIEKSMAKDGYNYSNNIVADKFQIIKSQISLLQAIEYYGLNPIKKGSRYWILCPFHADKNPSMAIYDEAYHCYGCQAHGDVIDFVSRYFGLSSSEALEKLANDFGIPLLGIKPNKEIQKKAIKRQKFNSLLKNFKSKYDETYDYLCKLFQAYTKIKSLVEEPDDMDLEAFVEACKYQDLIEYWIDTLRNGSLNEQLDVIKEVKKWRQEKKKKMR